MIYRAGRSAFRFSTYKQLSNVSVPIHSPDNGDFQLYYILAKNLVLQYILCELEFIFLDKCWYLFICLLET